jgi:hypothetical protein
MDAHDIRFDPEVQVLGHENDRILLFRREVVSQSENAIVVSFRIEAPRKINGFLMVHLDAQGSTVAEGDPCGELAKIAKVVEDPRDGSRIAAYFILSFLLIVEFLDDGEWNNDLVFLKSKERFWIVKKDVGV